MQRFGADVSGNSKNIMITTLWMHAHANDDAHTQS